MKKKFLFLLVLSLLLSVSAPMLSGCASERDVTTLYVYNWGEYISDGSDGTLDVNAEFEKYCKDELGMNVEVNYSTFSSNESMYAKISSGSAVYDVIIPSDYMIQRMVSENLLAPLDISKIPNYQYIDDKFKGDNVYYEDDTDDIYSVPYFYGMVGIIYNTEIVSEEDAAIESWELMWNEAYARDILQFNNSRDAFGTALYYLGYDVNEATDEEWNEALELLRTQKDLVQGYVMDEIFNKMMSGSAAIASYYAGDYISMYEDNDSLSFYYPKEGTNSYVDAMCIPANSKNYDLASEYINFMCSEEIAVANAEYTYYASPLTTVAHNPEYQEYMLDVHPDSIDILYGEKTDSVPTQAYLNLSPERLTLLNSLWEELKIESSIGNGIYICCGVILGGLITLGIVHTVKKRRRAKYYD
ncbi:MAG: spermidine/putrescine ABC transporter substrate-binding protein [Clostridia bacterium]|nr:spermidine/putrescine ABC transporter substrate-binding protein [Clostridia bacterium]